MEGPQEDSKADMALYSVFVGFSLQGMCFTRPLNRNNPIEAKVKYMYPYVNPPISPNKPHKPTTEKADVQA